jgi:hypothetical protein
MQIWHPYLDTEGGSSYASVTWVTGNVTGHSTNVHLIGGRVQND